MDIFEEFILKNKRNPNCRALTCKSYGEVHKRKYGKDLEPTQHNSDLATYGDALLKFALCTILLDKSNKLTKEKEIYEKDAYLIETIAKHYGLLDYMNFDRDNEKILQLYKYFEKENTKYIATTVEAVLGAIYQQNKNFEEICTLVESWMNF